ncbi:MAG: hypothetical protein GX892_09765 [Thermoanaerobacteraceae bacterium]|nr:hypothetical protein [Thermoanaerobacteraceae bacterium]
MLRDLPEFHGNSPVETLYNFYTDLGWDGETGLEPSDFLMAKEDHTALYKKLQSFAKNDNDIVGIALSMLQKGPSSDKNIPVGKIKIKGGIVSGRTRYVG